MAVFLFVQPLLAQSGHPSLHRTCPLSGAKRTCLFALQMSAYDPKRTSARYSPLIEPRGFTVMIAHSICVSRLLRYLPCLLVKSASSWCSSYSMACSRCLSWLFHLAQVVSGEWLIGTSTGHAVRSHLRPIRASFFQRSRSESPSSVCSREPFPGRLLACAWRVG